MSTLLRGRMALASALAVLSTAACGDLLSPEKELTIDETGVVGGFVFLDVDGSGTLSAVDEPATGIRVRLIPEGGGGAVASATTDTLGVFRMIDVPVGGFRVAVDTTTVPDSVRVFGLDSAPFILAAGDTVVRNFRVSFPTFTLAEIREMEPGVRVFTHGFALNVRVPFGDGAVHLREGDTYLRATSVERSPLSVGDSVRFLGRIDTEAGRPVLNDVRVFIQVTQADPVPPVEITTASAATANGEVLDAALVRARNAAIVDSFSVGPDLVVVADDGSGPVDVVLRGFLPFDRTAMEPGTTQFTVATGLLVPILDEGGLRWRLTPRGTGDLTLADVPDPAPALTAASAYSTPVSGALHPSTDRSHDAPGMVPLPYR
jgi:hypothetical protein